MHKVLVVTEEGRGGGALGRIRLVADALQGKIETIVLAPSSADKYINSLESLNIKTYSTNLHPLSSNFVYFLKYLIWFIPEIWSICNIIKDVRPDLVHCNGSWQIKGILAARVMGIKSIWQMNDTYQPKPVLYLFKLLGYLPTAFIHASTRTRTYYNAISTALANKIERIIQAPVVKQITIQNRPHVFQRSPLRLILVGYINPHKGIDILIEALSFIASFEVECDIVGPVLETKSDYKRELDMLATAKGVKLNFLGFKKVDHNLFKGYDFYCCSSRREASPMSVWEALSYGLPVISTPVGDIAEIVAEYKCGYMATDLTPEALAGAIKAAQVVDQVTYDKMSQASLKASALFDHQKIAEQYLSFYSEVMSA